MPQIQAISTAWSNWRDFSNDVFNAFVRIGLPPPAAALLTAHTSLSTGWGKSTFNYNLAGVKLCSGCDDTYDYFVAGGTEVIDDIETERTPMKWRAFATLDEGVSVIWKTLQNARYDSARALLLAGDPEYFAEVGRNGWYTASPNSMKSQMTSRLNDILSVVDVSAAAGGGSFLGLLLGVGLGLGLWWLIKMYRGR